MAALEGIEGLSRNQLSRISPAPIISIVSEAELRVLAEQNGWGPFKMRMLEQLMDYLTVIPIPYRGSLNAYVEIDTYSRNHGVTMGKNDLWIAATARAEGATILTTDQDFDHLADDHQISDPDRPGVKRIYIDPVSRL